MKNKILFAALLMFSTYSIGQVEMTIEGVAVASGDTFYYDATTVFGWGGGEDMTLLIENTSNNVMDLQVERCKIIDVPGWTVSYTVFGDLSDPFGGTVYSSASMTGQCWTTLVAVPFSNGGEAEFRDNLESSEYTCAQYRYYVWNGSILEDSVDVQYCRTAWVELNEVSLIDFEVYPNPTENSFTVNLNLIGEAVISLMSIEGKILDEIASTGTSNVFDSSDLLSGLYIVQVKAKSGEVIQKRIQIL